MLSKPFQWDRTGGAGVGVGAQENRVGDGREAESRGWGSKGLKEWEAGEKGGGGGGGGRGR